MEKFVENLKDNIKPLALILILPGLNLIYFLLNRPHRGEVYNLVLKVDVVFPFIKIFIFPYMCWYPFIITSIIYFCFYDKRTYYNVLMSVIIGVCVCYITFYFFQTTVPRPGLTGTDFVTRFTEYIYSVDKPYNCFPSIHILECYILMRAVTVSSIRNKKNMTVIYTFSILIILATQFIKQHVFLDLVSAVLLGEITFRLSESVDKEKLYNNFKERLKAIKTPN